jgi:hypothetical protein
MLLWIGQNRDEIYIEVDMVKFLLVQPHKQATTRDWGKFGFTLFTQKKLKSAISLMKSY